MEYYFDEIDPTRFQRLINTILVARFGEDARLTPLRGKDGGRDGETAPGNPYFEFQVGDKSRELQGPFSPRGSDDTSFRSNIIGPPKGNYLKRDVW